MYLVLLSQKLFESLLKLSTEGFFLLKDSYKIKLSEILLFFENPACTFFLDISDHCSTRYEQSFQHNKHTHTKLQQTNIPGTIIKFIANYIKGHEAYTTYRNHTSRQSQFKTGIPQGGVVSPTLVSLPLLTQNKLKKER